jgi:AcrR family transcriptional regulator
LAELPDNETRARILDIADELFSKRGYAAVRLRDIAEAVGMRHASLYYYVPGGKKQLFVEVMERNFQRHRDGLTTAIARAGDDLRQQMYAVAAWLAEQPPIDMARMVEADMHEIDPAQAEQLMGFAYDALRLPLVTALQKAQATHQINMPDLDVAAMAMISLAGSVHHIPPHFGQTMRHEVGRQLVDMLLDGWLVR